MRVGTRIKELCAALEGMGSATAAEIHQAAHLPPQQLSTGDDFERTLKNRT